MGEMSGMRTIICDIDGTIADNSHRQHHVQNRPKDWKAYNATMHADGTHHEVISLLNRLRVDGEIEVVLCTGREEVYRDVTAKWLETRFVDHDKLMMRPVKDYRGDEIVKSEMLDALLSEGRTIWFVIDDRQKVVDMWRARGLTCLQCRPGDF